MIIDIEKMNAVSVTRSERSGQRLVIVCADTLAARVGGVAAYSDAARDDLTATLIEERGRSCAEGPNSREPVGPWSSIVRLRQTDGVGSHSHEWCEINGDILSVVCSLNQIVIHIDSLMVIYV